MMNDDTKQDLFKVDKTAFSVGSLQEADDETDYWLTRSPEERLRAIELTRRVLYGYDPNTSGLQRIFAVAQQSRS